MRHQLDNGLTILLEENHSARVVAFQAWIQAGSGDETDSESGLAHLHEHMLFKGTAGRGVGMIARDIEAAGGDINASTSHDQTVYHLVMPSRDFLVGAETLADAVRNSTFEAAELEKEKTVVLEEISRSEDMPSGRLSRHLFDLAYTKHPYRRPVLGTVATVSAHTRDDVLAFYRRHYRPQKTTLVVVGDFEEQEALASLRALFEDWSPSLLPGEAEQPSPRVPEPRQDGLRLRVLEEDVRECHLALSWPVPRVGHDDIAALDVLSVLLGHGESSRLVSALRRRAHVVNAASAYVYAPKDPGVFMLGAQAPAGNAAAALSGLLEEVGRVRSEPPGEDEIEKAKTIIESDIVYQSQTVQGHASRLGFFETVAGAVEQERIFYRQVRRVSADDVARVADTYLRATRLSLAALVPAGVGFSEADARDLCLRLDEGRGEASGGQEPSSVRAAGTREGEVTRTVLSSGTTLLIQPDPSVGLVTMRAVHVGGQRYEAEETAGVSNLAGRLLTAGTDVNDAQRIASLVDGWAGSLHGESGRNSFGMEAEYLSRFFEPGMRLLAECMTRSTFPEEELEKERALMLEEIAAKEDYPSEIAFDLFRQTLWRHHPYRMDLRGTPESLGAMTVERLREHVRRRYHPSRMHLAIVGDVTEERAVEIAEELFGAHAVSAFDEPVDAPEVPVERPVDEPRRVERRLTREQSHIVLGFPGVRLSDPERFTLEVISTVLSGQGGRLFVELRDRKSLAYSVGSFSQEGLDPGFFGVYIGCSPARAEEAIEAIRRELARLRETMVSVEEVDRSKRYLIGTHEIGLQRPGARAAVLAFDDAYGTGHLAHREYASHIESVSREMVLEAASRYLDPTREVLAVVGP